MNQPFTQTVILDYETNTKIHVFYTSQLVWYNFPEKFQFQPRILLDCNFDISVNHPKVYMDTITEQYQVLYYYYGPKIDIPTNVTSCPTRPILDEKKILGVLCDHVLW